MKAFKTVFKFEYMNYLKSKTFIITTLIILIGTIIGGSIPTIMSIFDSVKSGITGEDTSKDNTEKETIDKFVIVDKSNSFSDETLTQYFPNMQWERLDSMSGIEDKLTDDTYAFAVEIDGLDYKYYHKGEDMFSFSSGLVDEMIISNYRNDILANAGFSDTEIEDFKNIQTQKEFITVGKDISQTYWVAYALLFLLYMATLMYGQYVSMSVVTEKTSKAMELLITSAKPLQLMFGKVLGVGAAGLTQMLAIMVTSFVTINVNMGGWTALNPMVGQVFSLSITPLMVIYVVVFFLLAFFSFAFIYAACASTVSRIEDAGSAQLIPMLFFIAGFMVAIMGMMSVNAAWVKICSFVPLLSPLVMFMRICITDIPVYQIIIAVVLNCLYIFVAAWVSSKIYKVGVMMYGNKLKIGTIIKMLKQS